MVYFNTITPQYLDALKRHYGFYWLKLELLSDNETVIGEIVKPVSLDSQGQININYQQITRRSCSLSLINVDNQYAPNQLHGFGISANLKYG